MPVWQRRGQAFHLHLGLVRAGLCRVRHEAGEALGAIGTEECLQPLREHVNDSVQEVRGACAAS